jgi:Ser/Thr protein kinase RdoA (MazF antagonist)
MTDLPYAQLTPDLILSSMEICDYRPTGRFLALNSYENRVYQVEIDEGDYRVVKFYRPGRWSDEAILEEHAFAAELEAAEVPVVAPLSYDGQTLLHYQGYRFAVYPRRGGRWPELEDQETLRQLGRFIGRIHQVGRAGTFVHRLRFSVDKWGHEPVAFLLDNAFVPAEMESNYAQAAETLLQAIEEEFTGVGSVPMLRLHGDFHPGNVLATEQGFHIVDLDDCCTGPAMQDLWMMLSGEREDMVSQLLALLEGYETFTDFDYRQLPLIEPLRGLRLLHYSAWLARRWEDPAFPKHFPWFNTPRYWEEQINTLREQVERIEQPVLQLH